MLTAAEVEGKIESTIRLLERRTDEFAQFVTDAAEANNSKLREQALLTIQLRNMDQPDRVKRAYVHNKTADLSDTAALTAGTRDSCRESLLSLRAELTALQTLLRTIAGQV